MEKSRYDLCQERLFVMIIGVYDVIWVFINLNKRRNEYENILLDIKRKD